jgi:ribosomal protein L37AE/L43A
MPALGRVPLPAPGEHASGYLRRLSDENALLLRDFRAMFGIRRISPRSSTEAWSRLARGLGVPIETFSPMMWRPVSPNAKRWISFIGHEIHDSYLYLNSNPVCRPCLSSSGIVRSAWSLRLLTACHVHETRLSDACPRCGSTIRLMRSYEAWTCGQCGADLRSGAMQAATEDEIAIARWLDAALIETRGDPTVTSDLPLDPTTSTLHEMLTSLAYLGQLQAAASKDCAPRQVRAQHSPLFLDIKTTADELRQSNRSAVEILSDWPSAYHSILDRLIDKYPAPPNAPPLLQHFASTAGMFAVRRLQDRVGQALPFITSSRLEFLEARIGYRPRARIPRRSLSETGEKLQAPAANLLSQEAVRGELFGGKNVVLTPIIESGALTPLKIGHGRIAFGVDEVRSITAIIRALPPPPPGRTDLRPAMGCLKSLTWYEGASAEFIRSILDGRLETYSSGPTLHDLLIPQEAYAEIRTAAKLRHSISRGEYADLSQLNRLTRELWGPLAIFRTREADQLVAAGKLRFKRVSYKRRGDPRRYHVGDIVRDIQSWIGPVHFDLEALERYLPESRAAATDQNIS